MAVAGGREKRIVSRLTALSNVAGGETVNIPFMLPRFARLRLCTLPEAWHNPAATNQDSFVFTKNDTKPWQPCVLMRLPNVLPTNFAADKPGRLHCLRHKRLRKA